MNEQLQDYARSTLKDALIQCSEAQQLNFKRMYSHTNLTLSIEQVVDRMHEDSLDWAMQQAQNTGR